MLTTATFTDEELERTFRLAYFLIPNLNLAFSLTIAACDLISMIRRVQSRRLKSSRHYGVTIPDEALLQFAVFLASDELERKQEAGDLIASEYQLTRDDFIVRYVKHLIWTASRKKSCYVAIALGCLLYRYTPMEIVRLSYGCFDEANIRRVKSRVMRSLKERFGHTGIIADGGGDLNVRPAESQDAWLVREALKAFTPWGENHIQATPDKPAIEIIFDATASLPEWDRTHGIIDPDCAGIERLVREYNEIGAGRRLADPDRMLAIPAFEGTPSDDPSRRINPPALTDIEKFLLRKAAEQNMRIRGMTDDAEELYEELYARLFGLEEGDYDAQVSVSNKASELVREIVSEACSERTICYVNRMIAMNTTESPSPETSAILRAHELLVASRERSDSLNSIVRASIRAAIMRTIEEDCRSVNLTIITSCFGGTGAMPLPLFSETYARFYRPSPGGWLISRKSHYVDEGPITIWDTTTGYRLNSPVRVWSSWGSSYWDSWLDITGYWQVPGCAVCNDLSRDYLYGETYHHSFSRILRYVKALARAALTPYLFQRDAAEQDGLWELVQHALDQIQLSKYRRGIERATAAPSLCEYKQGAKSPYVSWEVRDSGDRYYAIDAATQTGDRVDKAAWSIGVGYYGFAASQLLSGNVDSRSNRNLGENIMSMNVDNALANHTETQRSECADARPLVEEPPGELLRCGAVKIVGLGARAAKTMFPARSATTRLRRRSYGFCYSPLNSRYAWRSDYFVPRSFWPTNLKRIIRQEADTVEGKIGQTISAFGGSVPHGFRAGFPRLYRSHGFTGGNFMIAVPAPAAFQPHDDTPDTFDMDGIAVIRRGLDFNERRRQDYRDGSGSLIVRVDGKERLRFNRKDRTCRTFRISVDSVFIEVCGSDIYGDLRLAAFPVPTPGSLLQNEPCEDIVTTESGQVIRCRISPILSKGRETIGHRVLITWDGEQSHSLPREKKNGGLTRRDESDGLR